MSAALQAKIIVGDALAMLRTLPDESANCCVTSPPYWGLRDYGVDGQIGLEETFDEFLARLVAVFREVRRVLRSDGVAWVNLGSSYASGDTSPTRSPRHLGAPACGNGDTGLQGSPGFGPSCPDCGGELRVGYWSRRGRTDCKPQRLGRSRRLGEPTGRDIEPTDSSGEPPLPPSSPLSTTASSTANGLVVCDLEATGGELQSKSPTSPFCALQSDGTASSTLDTIWTGLTWVDDRLGTALACSACGYSTMRRRAFKPKDLIPQPWLFADALQADGWWLRSDCIWHKPNPMPESITDRPTKAHEYVFLLTKSARYFYDAEAVRQPYAGSTVAQRGQDYVGVATKNYQGAKAQDPSDTKRRVIESMEHRGGANLRTVWSITTSPYAGAHFATFPEALAERCILSGCPSGGTVLDPFTGSGTTGAVAVRLGRSFVGTELNPEYAELARQRIDEVQPLFTKAHLVAEAAKEAKP